MDECTLVSVCGGEVRLWTPTSSQSEANLKRVDTLNLKHSSPASLGLRGPLSWNRSGQYVLGLDSNNSILVLDRLGNLAQKIDYEQQGTQGHIYQARFASQEGRWVAALTTNQLMGFDRHTAKWHVWAELSAAAISSVSSDGYHLTLNSDESLVAYSVGDQIFIHDRPVSSTYELQATNVRNISALAFSTFRKTLLAVGTNDGSVHLLDATNKTAPILKPFHGVHQAPISDIAFSPFNRYLMVSVSLDKKFTLFDVEKQATVRSISTEDPLQSISFRADGALLAMGTLNGRILLYDLAMGAKRPCCTVLVTPSQRSSQHGVFIAFRVVQVNGSKSNSTPKRRVVSHSSNPTVTPSYPPSNTSVRPSSSKTVGGIITPSVTISSVPPTTRKPIDDNYMDVFSPVANKKREFKLPTLPILNSASKSEPIVSVLKTKKESKRLAPVECADTDKTTADAGVVLEGKKKVQFSKSCSKLVEEDKIAVDSNTSFSKSLNAIPNSDNLNGAAADVMESVKQMEKIVLEESTVETKITDKVISKLQSQAPSQNSPPMSEFSITLIKNTVQECMREFQTELRQDIRQLHLEVLRQFEIQRQDLMESMHDGMREMLSVLVPATYSSANPFLQERHDAWSEYLVKQDEEFIE